MHIRAFGIRATTVLRDEFLSWKVLRNAKNMETTVLNCTLLHNENDSWTVAYHEEYLLKSVI